MMEPPTSIFNERLSVRFVRWSGIPTGFYS